MGILNNIKIYKGRKNKKSVILNKHRTIINQIYEYLKKHNIILNRYGIKNKELIDLFITSVGLEVPNNTNKLTYLFDVYESSECSFLKAHYDRPDVPPHIWRELRDKVFKTYGKICLCCNSTIDISVDHIKPYSLYPELCIDFDNLQPLCRICNSKKSNRIIIDYRVKVQIS